MVRDEEIARLTKYAEGMGLKVRFSRENTRDFAAWTLDGSELFVFTRNCKAKIDVVLSMIHELGHHCWFVHERKRRPDLKFEEALDRMNVIDENLSDEILPKKHRQTIYDREKAGTAYWEGIYKETDMRFPIWKLYAAMEMDMWVYEEFLKTGRFPPIIKRKAVSKEISRSHKERYGK
jgi:hypothetical protein